MKRPYYRKSKSIPITSNGHSSNMPALRERILNGILLGITVAGAVALAIYLSVNVPQGNWDVIILNALVYLGLLFITFYKKLPYMVRAIGLELAIFTLGVTSILLDGIAGNGRLWFLGMIALSGILFGLKSGVYASLLASLTYLGIGGLMVKGIIQSPPIGSLPSNEVFLDWILTCSVFIIVAVVIVIALYILMRDLGTSLEKENTLSDDLNKDRDELEKRTGELDHRLVQIHTAAEISHYLSSDLDPLALFQDVVELIRQRFDLYYVGIYLLDDIDEYAVLRAGTGDAGQKMIDENHQLPVSGSSTIGWAITHRQPKIFLDTGEDAARFSNPHLPKTHSEVVLPIINGDQLFGAVSVQSSKSNAFDNDDVTILQVIADSMSASLQNARLLKQVEQNLEVIRALNRQYLFEAWRKISAKTELNQYSYSKDQSEEMEEGVPAINLPIALRDQVIGQVSLDLPSPELSSDDLAFVEQITNQAALAMENVRLLQETQRRANHERLVTEIVKKARASADLDSIIRTTLGELGKSMQAVEGVIHLEVPEAGIVSRPDRSEL